MASVDPDDDTISRFVVSHYRFDPERRERRHVVVAAFDNEREFISRIEAEATAIDNRRMQGENVDPTEHASGIVLEPGYHRRAENGHHIRRAIEHGVSPRESDYADLPHSIAVARSDDGEKG
jgi:hypothetical protein